MELLIVLGMTFLFGMVGLSALAQRNAPAAPVVILRTEPLERAESDGGAGLLLFVVVVVAALAML